MVNTTDEILLTVGANNNASNVFSNIDSDAKSMASSISSALSSINTGMMNLGQVSDNVMSSLTGKSALDNIFGTTSKAETNAVLLNNMLDDAEKHYDSFYKKVDDTTDSSLTSMQELIPALKAFKSATGATDKEMTNITDEIANFGAAVLAQTGSTDLAQQSMMDLSKGVKGAFASLDQYGITEDALKRTGYWNGDEKDVEGFMKAVQKVTGSTKELMETNTGLDALIGKSFSRAGKKIGNEFLPVIKDIKRGFINLDNEMGGSLAASMLVVSGGIDAMNQGFWNISTTVNGVRDLKDGFVTLKDVIKGTGDAAKETGDIINAASNGSDILSGAAGAGGAASAGAQAAKGASKGEKALEGGMDALFMADMLKGNKKSNETAKDVTKELEKLKKQQNRIQDEMDYVSGFGSNLYTSYKSKFSKSTNAVKKMNLVGELKKSVKGETGSHSKGFMLDRIMNFKGFSKDFNKEAKEKAGKLSKELKNSSREFVFDNDLLKEWEQSEWGLTDAIKNKVGNFKTSITGAFSSIKNFDLTGTIKSPFKKLMNLNLGGMLQGGLEKGLGGLSNIASTIKGKITSFGSSLAGIKNIDIAGKLKGLDQKLFQGIKGFSFKDSFGSLKNAFSGLKGTKEITEGVTEIEKVGEAVSTAGPATEAAATGAGTTAAGATSLSAAFTSMIVPLLALSATIMIMIPIVSVIAAEGMFFLKLLGEFMESLHFENIDLKGATKGISQIATALAWVGVAMAAMSFAGIMTGLAVITGGFLGITGPLDIAVSALKEAGEKLSAFNSIGIDPSVATTIQTIGETLGAVSSAMGALTWNNVVTGFSNFVADILGFSSVTDGLEQAKNDIMDASSKLNEFSDITPLDESVATNIQNVCDSLASVGAAMDALRSIRDGQNWDDMVGGFISGIFGEGVDIQTALDNVKDDVIDASKSLAGFTGISEIDEDVSTKIKTVGDTLTSVNDIVNNLKSMVGSGFDNWVDGLFGEADVEGGLEKIKTDLITASQKLAALSGLSEIEEGVTEKITAVGDTLGKVSEVAGSLTSLPDMGDFDSSIITTAVTNVQTAATELSRLNETTFDGSNADTILSSIQTTLQSVKDTLSAASGFTEPATGIGSQIVSGVKSGISPLTSTVQGAVTSATSSAASDGWTGGAYIGTSTTNGMKSSLKIKDTMETEVGYALTAMTNKTQDFYNAGAALGKAANDGFQSQPAINPGSPGNLAHVMMDEVGYILAAMKNKYSAAKNTAMALGKSIYEGFGNPSLDMDMFTNGGQLTAEHIGALQTTISRAPEKADNRPVAIYIGEGAVNVDARNKTEQEAKGLLTLALEGLDHITNVDVDGV